MTRGSSGGDEDAGAELGTGTVSTLGAAVAAAVAMLGSLGTSAYVGTPKASAAPTTWFVNATTGSDSNPCTQAQPCATIPQGIAVAADGDTISVAAGTYGTPSPSTIVEVDKSLTITGAGARSTTVANTVQVDLGKTVTLSGLKVDTSNNELGVRNVGGTLTISASAITGNGNNISGSTAGIDNLTNFNTITGNAVLTVIDSTISGNGTGGLDTYGGLRLQSPGSGLKDSATLINTTVSGNQGEQVGGIFADISSSLTTRDTTISANTSPTVAGGIQTGTSATATLTNTVLAANTSGANPGDGPDCVGKLTDGTSGHNLLGNNTNCTGLTNGINGDQVGTGIAPTDPKLASLANNGGPTDTMAVQNLSPAIGAGDATDCQTAPVNNLDQRSDSRHADTRGDCDIGAYDTGSAATWFVNASAPSDPSCAQASAANPFKTIPAAIACANNGDIINVAAGTYGTPSPSTIVEVDKSLTITGAGARSTTVANTVQVDLGKTVTLSGLKVDTSNNELGVRNVGGTLTISASAITGNGNNISGSTAGIDNLTNFNAITGNAVLTVIDSTISGNGTGGLDTYGGLRLQSPGSGLKDSATLINTTVSGNQGEQVGGIFADISSSLTTRDTTISANTSPTVAGGIQTGTSATATLTNTVLAGNTSGNNPGDGPDCVGTLTDGTRGHNLLGNNTNCTGLTNGINGDQVGTGVTPIDPKLSALANNGGPTDTMAVQNLSPAIGAGDATDCQTAPVNNLDQRGDPRHADTRGDCDIGAYDTVPAEPYHTLAPVRITDTRPNSGFPNSGMTLGPGSTLDVQVTGAGGVPATGVTAVVLNVTATNPTKQSFLTVWPTGAARPTASNLNFSPGQTVPNLAEVGLGTAGKVSVFNPAGSVDVVVDVEGYAGPTATTGTGLYNPLTPARITDTRSGSGFPNAGKTLAPGATLPVQVTGAGGVPPGGVGAVVLNVTATKPTKQSFLTVWPTGAARPTVSNLNFSPGQTVPNRVQVPVGTGGQVSIFNPAGSVDVVVDVGGYFTDASNPSAFGSQFTPLTPARITDTRPNSGFPNAGKTLGPTATLPVQVAGAGGVPAPGVTGAVMNVTVTNTTQQSFLTVWPTGANRPTASDLNWVAGETVPNLVVVRLGVDGTVQVFNAAGSTDVVVDVSGYYSNFALIATARPSPR